MARTKQTARKTTGGKCPRKDLATMLNISELVSVRKIIRLILYTCLAEQIKHDQTSLKYDHSSTKLKEVEGSEYN